MPQRSLFGDFGIGSGEAPPSYDTSFTPEEFEAKAAAVAEETRVNHGKQRAVEESGPSQGLTGSSNNYNEFEDWDDARFEAAAAAYQLRQARMQQSASPHPAHIPANRAQSPRADAGTPRASTSRATSPRPVDRPQFPQNSINNPGQLPTTRFDSTVKRNLPQQPNDVHRGGPSDSHNQQPTYIPQQTVAPQAGASSSSPWMSGGSSDGHGRASLDAPPPFAPMDPSTDFPTSPISESNQNGPVSQQQAPPEVREDRYSTIPPPPPANIPQAPVSAPLQPTTSSSPPAFVPPPVMHRHSDVPSSTPNTYNVALPARPRLSDIPSHSGRPNVTSNSRSPPPPTFSGAHHATFPGFVPPSDKKPLFAPKGSEMASRSQALYASANVRMNTPSVRIDLNKLAYSEHGQNQPAHGVKEEAYAPGSFYSSSVSSVMKKRALPQPQVRRNTNESHYSAQGGSPPPHAMPYNTSPQMPTPFYGQSTQNHANQGFYPHGHMQSTEVNMQVHYQPHFATPQEHQHQQQMHHNLPQGYPPVMQNHWTPAPDRWNNYGQP